MNYQDFTIRISSSSEGKFRAFVQSPMGSGETEIEMPFSVDELSGVLAGVARTVRGSAEPTFRDLEPVAAPSSPDQRPSTDLGVRLYRTLFSDAVQSMLDMSMGSLRGARDTGLRIRLEMDLRGPGMASVASLPWELLRKNATDVPLSVSKRTTVVRAIDVMQPADPIPFEPPLRILAIVSNPQGTAGLKLDDERKRIEESWGKLDGVEVHFVKPTREAILDACAAHEFHVIHFMGHGDFDEKTSKGVLYLEREDGSADPLDSERLKAIFLDESDSLRLVFLNACKTAVSAEDTGLDPFAGIATMLIEVGIPAVVAMQFPISDDAAIRFADTFYRRIVQGMPVDTAVAEGRKALWVEGNPHDEWATPVLFMRSRDGILFQQSTITVEPIPEAKPAEPTPVAPPPVMPAGAAGAITGFFSGPQRYLRIGAAAAVVLVGGFLGYRQFLAEPPLPPLPEVAGIQIASLPDAMYTGERAEFSIQLIEDDLPIDPFDFGELVTEGYTVLPRSAPEGALRIERAAKPISEAGMAFSVAGAAEGLATIWAVVRFPGGDSLVANPQDIVVSLPQDELLRNAIDDMNAAIDSAEIADMSDAAVIALFEAVEARYADVLSERQLEELDGWIDDLAMLSDLEVRADGIHADPAATILEQRRAALMYLDSAAAIRGGNGPAAKRLDERAQALAQDSAQHGVVNRIVTCTGNDFCSPSRPVTTFTTGQVANATVWYVVNGTERIQARVFRDGAQINVSEVYTASRGGADGYRIRLPMTVDAPGVYQVLVYNSIGQVVGRSDEVTVR